MTKKVNGNNLQGSWFERDTTILHVTGEATTGADFISETVNSNAEQIMRVIQTRGTVLGYNVVDADTAAFMVGHAGGAFSKLNGDDDADILGELADAINGIDGVTGMSVVAYAGFIGAVPAEVAIAKVTV